MLQMRLQNSGRIIDMKHYTVEITNKVIVTNVLYSASDIESR